MSVLDPGEYIAYNGDGDRRIAVVIRCDAHVLRVRVLAVGTGEDSAWDVVEEPALNCDLLLVLHPGDEPNIIGEAGVAEAVMGMDVPRLRELWSGRPAGRR